MTNLLSRYEQALKEAAPTAEVNDVPVGFVVTQSGRFMIKWSRGVTGWGYENLEDLMKDSIPLLERREVSQNN